MNKNRTIEELKPDEYNEAVGYYKNHAIIRFLNIEHWACLNIPEEFFEPLEMFLPENLESLDTVFTQIDYDKFTIHPGIQGPLQVFEITKGDKLDELNIKEVNSKLEDILAKHIGVEKVTLIQCGGGDKVISDREQWNDGSNTLCIKPGEVIVYARNYVTNKILQEHGIITHIIPSSELSRGRGGPRCMSMPLEREV